MDINVLVEAVTAQEPAAAFESWPSPPLVRGDPAANALGVLNDAKEFSLWLSPHILDGTAGVLREFCGWSVSRATQYQAVLERIASRSGGAVIAPQLVVTDCDNWEDNRILELAAESGAVLIVSNDDDLLRMSPWRGAPVIHPTAFVAKVDAMRRAQLRILRERST